LGDKCNNLETIVVVGIRLRARVGGRIIPQRTQRARRRKGGKRDRSYPLLEGRARGGAFPIPIILYPNPLAIPSKFVGRYPAKTNQSLTGERHRNPDREVTSA
jgi:hypothetical protein